MREKLRRHQLLPRASHYLRVCLATLPLPQIHMRTSLHNRPVLRIPKRRRLPPLRPRPPQEPLQTCRASSAHRLSTLRSRTEETYRRQALRGDSKRLKINASYRASVQSVMAATDTCRAIFAARMAISTAWDGDPKQQ